VLEESHVRTTRALTAGTALAGLALALQACATPPSTPAASSPEASAAGSSSPVPVASEGSAGGATPEETGTANTPVLEGKRKILIHISEEDKDWDATYEGPVAIGDGTGDGATFKIVPAAKAKGSYLIEALRPREEGGRWCVMGDTRDEPVSLGTVKCAENDTTLFKISATGEKDDKGRPTYLITNERYGAVQVKNDGSALYIQELGDGGARGTYSFVDRGAV
jgi:hypothetical protein